ncbi:MAG TPA: hypothetical protein VFF19_19815 [Reyranella sp.]|nr:hypothetical protein [Reyranella sp.]
MDSLLRLLLRFIVVPLGIAVGMFATMIVVMIGYWRIGDLLAGSTEVDALAMYDMLATATFLLAAVVLTMWVVAFIGILFAEGFGIRSWIFHTLNGAVSAWIGAQMFTPYPDTLVPFDANLYVVGAGLAGGMAYWLVAGWSAGFWKPVFAAPAQPVATTPAQPVAQTAVLPPVVTPAAPIENRAAPVAVNPSSPVVAGVAQPVVLPRPSSPAP